MAHVVRIEAKYIEPTDTLLEGSDRPGWHTVETYSNGERVLGERWAYDDQESALEAADAERAWIP